MTIDELIAEFTRRARVSSDTARMHDLVDAGFSEEYSRGITGHPEATAETHARSLEIYDLTIGQQRLARTARKDEALFKEVAAALRIATRGAKVVKIWDEFMLDDDFDKARTLDKIEEVLRS